jgi:hypothetical protein
VTQLTALLLSILSESIAAWMLVAACGWGSPSRAALAATIGTVATHWAAWDTIGWLMQSLSYAAAVVTVETAVVLLESLGFRWIVFLSWERAVLASLVANCTSTGLGWTLYIFDLV